jgi:hypothetical protein
VVEEEEEEEEEEITTALDSKEIPMCILGQMHVIIPNKD